MNNKNTKEIPSLTGIIVILLISIVIAGLSIWMYQKTHNELIKQDNISVLNLKR